jgi:Tfp pilus assembly protein PilN
MVKVRFYLYIFGVVAFAGLTVLSTTKIIDPDTASSVSAALTQLLGLFGVTVAGTAAYNINKQRHDGTFEHVEVSPVDQVVKGVQQVVEAKETAEREVKKVQDALSDLAGQVPVLGPLAKQVLDQFS